MFHAQGYGDRGGAAHEEAWHLWGRAGLVDGFSAAFRLADGNRDHRLDEQVLILFKSLTGKQIKHMRAPGTPLSVIAALSAAERCGDIP